MSLNNPKMASHRFLTEMYDDDYFPDELVKKGEDILVELCQQIEQQRPASLEELYERDPRCDRALQRSAAGIGRAGQRDRNGGA